MTHIFQPCDQYIIANLRKYLIREWKADKIRAFAQAPQEIAVPECFPTSIPVLRKCKITLLCRAIDALTVLDVQLSWEKTGLLRALFHQVPHEKPIFDCILSQVPGDLQENYWQDVPQPEDVQPSTGPAAEPLVQVISATPQPLLQGAPSVAQQNALVPAKRKRGRPRIYRPDPAKPIANQPSIRGFLKKAEPSKTEGEQAQQQSPQDPPPATVIPEAPEIDVIGEEDANGIEIDE